MVRLTGVVEPARGLYSSVVRTLISQIGLLSSLAQMCSRSIIRSSISQAYLRIIRSALSFARSLKNSSNTPRSLVFILMDFTRQQRVLGSMINDLNVFGRHEEIDAG